MNHKMAHRCIRTIESKDIIVTKKGQSDACTRRDRPDRRSFRTGGDVRSCSVCSPKLPEDADAARARGTKL